MVLEGLDGSGKSTQVEVLADRLDLEDTAEPTEGRIGRLIREELSTPSFRPDSLGLLFAADRMQHQDELDGVICERYVYSSLAYQAAQGVDPEWLCEMNRGVRRPNLVVLVDIEPERAMERVEGDRKNRDAFERRSFLEKVREEYLKIFLGREPYSTLRERYGFLDTTFKIIYGETSVRRVSETIESLFETFIEDHAEPPEI